MDSQDQKDIINKIKNSGQEKETDDEGVKDDSENLNESNASLIKSENVIKYYNSNSSDEPIFSKIVTEVLLKNNEFELKSLKISDLLNGDQDFKNYNSDFDGNYDDNNIMELYKPIIVVEGQLVDGYKRASILYNDYDEDDIEAFVSITNENIVIKEAEYKGKKVKLNSPKRGGSKKFYVYTKNDKGNVIKVSFGAKNGGGNLAVKINDPKDRKRFENRHDCSDKNDKTKPSYWSCRLPRYAKQLGLSGGGNYFW